MKTVFGAEGDAQWNVVQNNGTYTPFPQHLSDLYIH